MIWRKLLRKFSVPRTFWWVCGITCLLIGGVWIRFAVLSAEYHHRGMKALSSGNTVDAVAWFQKGASQKAPLLGAHDRSMAQLQSIRKQAKLDGDADLERMTDLAIFSARFQRGTGSMGPAATVRMPGPGMRVLAGILFLGFICSVFGLIFMGFTPEPAIRLSRARLFGVLCILFFVAWAFAVRHA